MSMNYMPIVDSRWRHRNGKIYQVTAIANIANPNRLHPITIVYRGENGNYWTRPFHDWHRSMTEIGGGIHVGN